MRTLRTNRTARSRSAAGSILRLEQLVERTSPARRRCLDAGLSSPLYLDEAIFLRAAEACSRENIFRVDRLADYADKMRRNACSCLWHEAPESAPSMAWVVDLLGQAMTKLGGLGGTRGLAGFIFAAEAINMDERIVTSARDTPRRRADKPQMIVALGQLIDGFSDGEIRDGLVEAAAFHCYDLLTGLIGHSQSHLIEGKGDHLGSSDPGGRRLH